MPGPCGTAFPANSLWLELQKTPSRKTGRGFLYRMSNHECRMPKKGNVSISKKDSATRTRRTSAGAAGAKPSFEILPFVSLLFCGSLL
jgi:hypothetical protein